MITRTSLSALAAFVLITVAVGCPKPANAGDGVPEDSVPSGFAHAHVREALLTKRVRARLLARVKASEARRIQITTAGETVTLTGQVQAPATVPLAGAAAGAVEGVRRVNNNLTWAAPDERRHAAVTAG